MTYGLLSLAGRMEQSLADVQTIVSRTEALAIKYWLRLHLTDKMTIGWLGRLVSRSIIWDNLQP